MKPKFILNQQAYSFYLRSPMKIKKKINYFLLISISVFSTNVFSQSKVITSSKLKMIEDRVAKELADHKNDPSKKFLLNMLAARETYQFRFYEKSFNYYSNAIAINVPENKTEAYINRIAISILDKDKKRISSTLNEAKNYFDKNSKLKTKEVEYYLNAIDKSLASSVDDTSKVEGFYGMYTSEESFKNLLKNKEYPKAFSLLNSEGIKKAQNSFNITTYDSLNVLINKKNVKLLYCNKEYNEYPNAYAYSTLICGLLNDYLKSGNFSDKKMKRAEKFFEEEDTDKKYLLDMVKEIK